MWSSTITQGLLSACGTTDIICETKYCFMKMCLNRSSTLEAIIILRMPSLFVACFLFDLYFWFFQNKLWWRLKSFQNVSVYTCSQRPNMVPVLLNWVSAGPCDPAQQSLVRACAFGPDLWVSFWTSVALISVFFLLWFTHIFCWVYDEREKGWVIISVGLLPHKFSSLYLTNPHHR